MLGAYGRDVKNENGKLALLNTFFCTGSKIGQARLDYILTNQADRRVSRMREACPNECLNAGGRDLSSLDKRNRLREGSPFIQECTVEQPWSICAANFL